MRQIALFRHQDGIVNPTGEQDLPEADSPHQGSQSRSRARGAMTATLRPMESAIRDATGVGFFADHVGVGSYGQQRIS